MYGGSSMRNSGFSPRKNVRFIAIEVWALSHGIATQAEMDHMDAQVMKEIEEALEVARQSPYPDPSELFEDMFANPIPLE